MNWQVDWTAVCGNEFRVPEGVPLPDLTTELTRFLGDPDGEIREDRAVAVLRAWVRRGIYDDLLRGLGDGMADGLRVGIGESGTDSVFRRCSSAAVLAACIDRDAGRPLVAGGTVLTWGDKVATWTLTEQDLREHVAGKGQAGAVRRGADALAALARSPHLMGPELTVLLDVVGERLTGPATPAFVDGETDHLAAVVVDVLRREKLPVDLVEAWLRRVTTTDVPAHHHNVIAFARSLHLQLALGERPPQTRADLMLVLVDVLRGLSPQFLGSPAPVQ